MYSDLQSVLGNRVMCSGNIPLSAASCIYLYSKKCLVDLDMCEICVNTHTHTHTHIATGVSSRVNILIIINTCKGGNSFLRELSALFRIRMPRLTH